MAGNRFKKPFFKTLFWHQNKWHRYGIIKHSLAVVSHLIKMEEYKMIPAGLLHDIGKAYAAYYDAEDIAGGCVDCSFTAHEDFGYHIIKNWTGWLVSDYTKNIVRYHYLIRALGKEKKRNPNKYRRLKRIWDKLDDDFKKDLKVFLLADDLGKKGF